MLTSDSYQLVVSGLTEPWRLALPYNDHHPLDPTTPVTVRYLTRRTDIIYFASAFETLSD